MKTNFFKKLFIKISKIFGYQIIDQNQFVSPTLEKKLNDDLSIINDNSIGGFDNLLALDQSGKLDEMLKV